MILFGGIQYPGNGVSADIVNVKAMIGNKNMKLYNGTYYGARLKSCNVKNVLIDTSSDSYGSIWGVQPTYCEGVVVTSNLTKPLKFYGSNFSDFYYSWKFGEIGLNMFDSTGIYQGKITEEWLLDKGAEKIG